MLNNTLENGGIVRFKMFLKETNFTDEENEEMVLPNSCEMS